jgi:hypothetical protein
MLGLAESEKSENKRGVAVLRPSPFALRLRYVVATPNVIPSCRSAQDDKTSRAPLRGQGALRSDDTKMLAKRSLLRAFLIGPHG